MVIMNLYKQIFILFFAFFNLLGFVCHAGSAEVGSTLHKKFDVALDDVPEAVTSVILKANPDFKMQEAQKERKHGNTYFDIEGLDADGNEIEFDMLLDADGSWSIAEIQRDLTLKQLPEPVVTLYNQKIVNVMPKRIIESDQGGGVIIYEFYTKEDDKEKKYEIKLAVEFLDTEWKH